jgi:hypothetical protein
MLVRDYIAHHRDVFRYNYNSNNNNNYKSNISVNMPSMMFEAHWSKEYALFTSEREDDKCSSHFELGDSLYGNARNIMFLVFC